MTLDEVDDLSAYWRENPPAHEMLQVVAMHLGWKPARSGSSAVAAPPMSEDEAAAFAAMVNGD